LSVGGQSATHRFFDLSLVSLDLLLELLVGVSQSVLQFAILVRLKRQLLHASLLLAHTIRYFVICYIITSAEEGGYVFGSVCLSVCLSVRRITRKLVNGF